MSTLPCLCALSVALAQAVLAAEGPCDIAGKAGNPCVAAHSTVRALYGSYAGPLYRVARPINNASANISVLAPGGIADITAQDKFCGAGDCVIATIFDQSPKGNHLVQRISDGVVHKMVNASRHKVGVANGDVFGMWFDPGQCTTCPLELPPLQYIYIYILKCI